MKHLPTLLIVILILIPGCAYWSSISPKYVSESRNFEASFPKGWKRDHRISKALLGTKDGIKLQYIHIARYGLDDDLPFTKRKLTKDMVTQEVADIAIDNLRSAPERIGLEVLENSPDSLCGLPGFRILAKWKSIEGLPERDLLYGLMIDDKYYEILYEAPSRYYFGRDSAEAVGVVRSFTLIDQKHKGK